MKEVALFYQDETSKYLHTYMPKRLNAYMPTWLHAYMPTCLNAKTPHMINFIKKFLNKEKVDYNNLMNHGAIVLDVRTQNEFESGHIPGSINIPVQILESQLKKLDKNKTIITCCASGMRSATARQLLLQHGFHHVYNGGGWNALYKKLQ